MNSVRGMMSKFYRDHGLSDPEASRPRPVSRFRAKVGEGVPAPVDQFEDAEVNLLRRQISELVRDAEQELAAYKSQLEQQINSADAEGRAGVQNKERQLERRRQECQNEELEIRQIIDRKENETKELHKLVMKRVEECLSNQERAPTAVPPERPHREQATHLVTTVVLQPRDHARAERFVEWLEVQAKASDWNNDPEVQPKLIRGCPYLAGATPRQVLELISLIRLIDSTNWRKNVPAFARVLAV